MIYSPLQRNALPSIDGRSNHNPKQAILSHSRDFAVQTSRHSYYKSPSAMKESFENYTPEEKINKDGITQSQQYVEKLSQVLREILTVTDTAGDFSPTQTLGNAFLLT